VDLELETRVLDEVLGVFILTFVEAVELGEERLDLAVVLQQ
jgi:hypothetical protein